MKRLLLAVALLICSVSAFAQSTSIWGPTDVPGATSLNASQIQFGTKFHSDIPGWIIAVRWYKVSGETGTHGVAVFSSTGTLLGSVASTPSETASGWQTASLANPVFVAAGTDYIVARHYNGGGTNAMPYTVASVIDSPPLHSVTGTYAFSTSYVAAPTTVGPNLYLVDVVVIPGYCGVFQ